ncbi:MAG: hypothetical protein HPY58_07390 [Firmicutes bacterium]|nr:hypothetical protein [Bacillota bacterium]
MKAINYRSEPFENRLKAVPEVHKVFSSLFHPDPATPVFEAIAGDPVTIRLLMPADKPRARSFVLHAHNYRQLPEDLYSQTVAVRGAITVGERLSAKIRGESARQEPRVTSCTAPASSVGMWNSACGASSG